MLMKQLIIAIIIVLSLATAGFALDTNEAAPSEVMILSSMFGDLEGTTLPGPAQKFIKTGDVNVYITSPESEISFSILIREGVIETIQSDISSVPTLDLRATQEFVESLEDSDNPLKAIKEGLKDDTFSYKAHGFFNKIKFKFLFTFMNVGSFVIPDESLDDFENEESEFEDEQSEDENIIITQTSDEVEEAEENNGGGLLTGSIVSEEIAEDVEEDTAQTHYVEFVDDGFNPLEITIKVGDTIVWQNVREGTINKAFLVGTQTLIKARSKILMPGDSYSWTFEKPGKFIFVDGIMTTKVMNVIVEE